MDSNSYLELSLKLQMVPLSLYPVKSLILLMVQGCLKAKLWTPLTVPDFCPQVSCDLFSGRTHAHPVLTPHRLFFVRSTYFVTNQPKIQQLILQVLNFRTVSVNLRKSDKISSVVIFWVNWWENMLIWQRITCSKGDSIALWTIIGSLEGPTALEVFIMQLLWIVKASWYDIPYDSFLSLWIKDRYS